MDRAGEQANRVIGKASARTHRAIDIGREAATDPNSIQMGTQFVEGMANPSPPEAGTVAGTLGYWTTEAIKYAYNAINSSNPEEAKRTKRKYKPENK